MGGTRSLRILVDQCRWLGERTRVYSTVLFEIVVPREELLSLTRRDIRSIEHHSHVVLEVKVIHEFHTIYLSSRRVLGLR